MIVRTGSSWVKGWYLLLREGVHMSEGERQRVGKGGPAHPKGVVGREREEREVGFQLSLVPDSKSQYNNGGKPFLSTFRSDASVSEPSGVFTQRSNAVTPR